MKITTIRSGGQTGVDRAALDVARELRIPIAGWCPEGGLAEDYPNPPGLTEKYPELRQTNYRGHSQRTVLNVWDADATLIIYLASGALSDGTKLTINAAEKLNKPYFILRQEAEISEVISWLDEQFGDQKIELNIAGPRGSSAPGTYEKAKKALNKFLEKCDCETSLDDI